MRRFFLFWSLLAVIFSTAAIANAQPHKNKGAEKAADKGIVEATKDTIEEVIEDVTEAITGESIEIGDDANIEGDAGAKGRENALEQIDRNIEKHGGEHHGLENARKNVAKGGESRAEIDEDKNLIEELADEINDNAKEIIDDATGETNSNAADAARKHKGKDNGAHPHKGKDK